MVAPGPGRNKVAYLSQRPRFRPGVLPVRIPPPKSERGFSFLASEPHQPSSNVFSQASLEPKLGLFHSPASPRSGCPLVDAQLVSSRQGYLSKFKLRGRFCSHIVPFTVPQTCTSTNGRLPAKITRLSP